MRSDQVFRHKIQKKFPGHTEGFNIGTEPSVVLGSGDPKILHYKHWELSAHRPKAWRIYSPPQHFYQFVMISVIT